MQYGMQYRNKKLWEFYDCSCAAGAVCCSSDVSCCCRRGSYICHVSYVYKSEPIAYSIEKVYVLFWCVIEIFQTRILVSHTLPHNFITKSFIHWYLRAYYVLDNSHLNPKILQCLHSESFVGSVVPLSPAIVLVVFSCKTSVAPHLRLWYDGLDSACLAAFRPPTSRYTSFLGCFVKSRQKDVFWDSSAYIVVDEVVYIFVPQISVFHIDHWNELEGYNSALSFDSSVSVKLYIESNIAVRQERVFGEAMVSLSRSYWPALKSAVMLGLWSYAFIRFFVSFAMLSAEFAFVVLRII